MTRGATGGRSADRSRSNTTTVDLVWGRSDGRDLRAVGRPRREAVGRARRLRQHRAWPPGSTSQSDPSARISAIEPDDASGRSTGPRMRPHSAGRRTTSGRVSPGRRVPRSTPRPDRRWGRGPVPRASMPRRRGSRPPPRRLATRSSSVAASAESDRVPGVLAPSPHDTRGRTRRIARTEVAVDSGAGGAMPRRSAGPAPTGPDASGRYDQWRSPSEGARDGSCPPPSWQRSSLAWCSSARPVAPSRPARSSAGSPIRTSTVRRT